MTTVRMRCIGGEAHGRYVDAPEALGQTVRVQVPTLPPLAPDFNDSIDDDEVMTIASYDYQVGALCCSGYPRLWFLAPVGVSDYAALSAQLHR